MKVRRVFVLPQSFDQVFSHLLYGKVSAVSEPRFVTMVHGVRDDDVDGAVADNRLLFLEVG